MGKVVGGGFRIGNSCTAVVDSCQCMAKPIQYFKVKKKKKRNPDSLKKNMFYFLTFPEFFLLFLLSIIC